MASPNPINMHVLSMFRAEWIHESPSIVNGLDDLLRSIVHIPGLRKFDERKKPPKLQAGLSTNFNLKKISHQRSDLSHYVVRINYRHLSLVTPKLIHIIRRNTPYHSRICCSFDSQALWISLDWQGNDTMFRIDPGLQRHPCHIIWRTVGAFCWLC